MNNYEAKQQARRERYAELAAKKQAESDALADRSLSLASVIPMGQPILIGHHSEKRHRNHLKRIDATMGRAVEAAGTADHYAQKAAAAGSGGISSDDPEAVVKLRSEERRVGQGRRAGARQG